jgi:hypothetical protein
LASAFASFRVLPHSLLFCFENNPPSPEESR